MSVLACTEFFPSRKPSFFKALSFLIVRVTEALLSPSHLSVNSCLAMDNVGELFLQTTVTGLAFTGRSHSSWPFCAFANRVEKRKMMLVINDFISEISFNYFLFTLTFICVKEC